MMMASGDLPPPYSKPDLIASSLTDKTLTIVQEWVWPGFASGLVGLCGISPELCLWHLCIFGQLFSMLGAEVSVSSSCVFVGHWWDRVAMDILDVSVAMEKGNRYVLVIVDCFSRWTEACPLPNKMAVDVADTFFHLIICCFGMPAVIHSDQGRKFENHLMQELCLLLGAHKTRTILWHISTKRGAVTKSAAL